MPTDGSHWASAQGSPALTHSLIHSLSEDLSAFAADPLTRLENTRSERLLLLPHTARLEPHHPPPRDQTNPRPGPRPAPRPVLHPPSSTQTQGTRPRGCSAHNPPTTPHSNRVETRLRPFLAAHQSQTSVHPGLTHAARDRPSSLPPQGFCSAAGSCHVASLAAFPDHPGRKLPSPPALFSTWPCLTLSPCARVHLFLCSCSTPPKIKLLEAAVLSPIFPAQSRRHVTLC